MASDVLIIDLNLKEERRVAALEYMPGDRRGARGILHRSGDRPVDRELTPWHGMMELQKEAHRLPAGSHVVAEIHYRSAGETVVDGGTLGLFLAKASRTSVVSDLLLDARRVASAGPAQKLRAETRLTADTYALALWPDVTGGPTSIEVTARNSDGSTDVLLFARNPQTAWPTPYIFRTPVLLRKGSMLSVVAYYAATPPASLRLRVSRY